jgi:hypothetical protein
MNYQIYDLLINPEYFRVEKDKLIEVNFIQLIKISILCKTSNRIYKNNKLLERIIASNKLSNILRNIEYNSLMVEYYPETSNEQLEIMRILSEYLFLNPYRSPISYTNIISDYKKDKLDPLSRLPLFKKNEYIDRIKNRPTLMSGLSHASLPCSVNRLHAIYN